MVQPVGRQEIIVIDTTRKNTVAIDPATGLPYFFVFVNNTSSSSGTYDSPYPTLLQAQNNSSPNDIIYVFPGDGTTKGMDSGIFLQANQKFWGSGISHALQTTEGVISIPVQSNSSPIITNTNSDTEGHAITLATNNTISGFTIRAAIQNAIYGTDPQSLEVSSCVIEESGKFTIEASFPGNASISLTNNQFLNNINGVFLTLNGTSSLLCSNNLFQGQTSVSEIPLEVVAESNICTALIQNNVFNNNTTGSIRFNLNTADSATISLGNNTFTNNGTGLQGPQAGSSFVVLATGTTNNCTVTSIGNTFSGNASHSLYFHTSGAFTTLTCTTYTDTMSNNVGSALAIATPTDTLILFAADNTITGCTDNGIAVISGGSTSLGTVIINNNIITDLGNLSNGIAINQDFSALTLTLLNNEIDGCEGTGILSYATTGIDSMTLNVWGNTISNCQNIPSNAASGIDIEQYTNLVGVINNNTLTDNTALSVGVMVGSTRPTPTACLTLTGNNSSTDYTLNNPVDGHFNLSPCNVDAVNVGTINTSGTITPVQSCPDATPCPP